MIAARTVVVVAAAVGRCRHLDRVELPSVAAVGPELYGRHRPDPGQAVVIADIEGVRLGRPVGHAGRDAVLPTSAALALQLQEGVSPQGTLQL